MQARYKFYEVVKISSIRSELAEVNGTNGAVLGMAENEAGEWTYAVQILDTDECWDVMEKELSSVGRIMSREDFYEGDSITVEVNESTNEGKLKN